MSTKNSDQEDAQDVLSTTLGDRYPPMTSENKKDVLELYKSNPRLLDDFTKIIDFMDFFQLHPLKYDRLFRLLEEIQFDANTTSEEWDFEQRIRFMVAVGFVDKAVEMYFQLRKEMGYTFLPNIRDPDDTTNMKCLHNLIWMFVKATRYSAGFCLCLARLDVLRTITEDLRHMRNMPGDILARGVVFKCSCEILHNCCVHPEVLLKVRDLGAVDCVKPFWAKSSSCCFYTSVRAHALMTLVYLVNDSERSLLQLDSHVFDLFWDIVDGVLAADTDAAAAHEWKLDQVLFALSVFAQLDNNRKIMSTDIFLHMLAVVLQNREKEEKVLALAIIKELGKSSETLQDLTRVRPLRKALDDLQCSADQTMAQDAATLLSVLPAEGDDHPHLTALLADQKDMLTMGEVDFVINQLIELCSEGGENDCTDDVGINQNTDLCAEGGENDCTDDVGINQNTDLCAEGGENDCTGDVGINQNTELCAEGGEQNCTDDDALITLLQALAELAQKPETAKEIVDKGGIKVLLRCLTTRSRGLHCLLVLRQISYHKECCDTLKVFPELGEILQSLRESRDSGLSHLAADIVKTAAIPQVPEDPYLEDSPGRANMRERVIGCRLPPVTNTPHATYIRRLLGTKRHSVKRDNIPEG